jgi:hypothetical protein
MLERLLEVVGEDTFRARLADDFGITPDPPKYAEMLKIRRGLDRQGPRAW